MPVLQTRASWSLVLVCNEDLMALSFQFSSLLLFFSPLSHYKCFVQFHPRYKRGRVGRWIKIPFSIFYGILIGTIGVIAMYIAHCVKAHILQKILTGILIVFFYGCSLVVYSINYVTT